MSLVKKILGVDMGNHNIKTSNRVIFKSVFSEHDYRSELNNEDVIMYGDRKYVVGKGKTEFDNTNVKSEKDTIPLFLNALLRSLNFAEYANLRVVVGLPLSQHKDKKLIGDMKDKYSGTFEFKYISNGVSKEILYNVDEVNVFPECLGAFYSLDEDMEGRDVLLVDIGGKTINIALFIDGEYVDSITLKFGTIDIIREVKEHADFVNTGADFTTDDIIKYMKRGRIKWDGKIDDMEYVSRIIEKYTLTIINDIKGKFPNYKAYEIMLSGGGVDIFEKYLSEHLEFKVIDDNIFANANGFYNVGVDVGEE